MPDYTEKLDYSSDAKDKQVEFFKGKVNAEKLLDVFSAQVQGLESLIKDFHSLRFLETATGVQLDGLGQYLLIDRGTNTDEQYRSRLKSAVFEKFNAGQVEPLLQAYKTLTQSDQVLVDQYYPATVILTALLDDTTLSDTDLINAAMQRVKAAGVELAVGVAKKGASFKFSTTTGQTGTGRGFSSTALGGDGGEFAKLVK